MRPGRHRVRLAWVVASMVMGLYLATTALAGPGIEFDHLEHHFGTVTQGKVVTHRYPFTNVGDEKLIIHDVNTPCGCTAVLPDKSELMPGESSYVEVNYDSSARSGEVTRLITVTSNDPQQPSLILTAVAQVDASMHAGFVVGETLFGPKCGSCHYTPNAGKFGQELYDSACWFCHGKYREGHTAPALSDYPQEMGPYLEAVIAVGKPGTEMPGFHTSQGGPLDDAQVQSLLPIMFSPAPPAPAPEPKSHEPPPVGDPNQPFFK